MPFRYDRYLVMVIKASCPYCGDVDLPVDGVRLVTYPQRPSLNYYLFDCVLCQHPVQKYADPTVVIALKDAVVHHEMLIPEEALEVHPLGPLSEDEILDWVNEVLKYL